MTIIVRRIGPTVTRRLRRCGDCRIGFGEIVGVFPSKHNAVVWLSGGDGDADVV